MNKKLLKITAIIAMVVLTILSVTVSSFAANFSPANLSGKTDGVAGTNEIKNVGNSVIGILQVVGIVLSVVVLIVLGIKYMMGSAEEKAEYKKTMIPYVVGAALIFAASALAQVVFQFFTGISAAQ